MGVAGSERGGLPGSIVGVSVRVQISRLVTWVHIPECQQLSENIGLHDSLLVANWPFVRGSLV